MQIPARSSSSNTMQQMRRPRCLLPPTKCWLDPMVRTRRGTYRLLGSEAPASHCRETIQTIKVLKRALVLRSSYFRSCNSSKSHGAVI